MYKSKRKNRIIGAVSFAASLTGMGLLFAVSSQTGASFNRMCCAFAPALFAGSEKAGIFWNAMGHIGAFAALAVCICFFFSTRQISNSVRRTASFCLTAAIAGAEEIHQFFIAGRVCLVRDMVVDWFGAFVAVVVWNAVMKKLTCPKGKSGAVSTVPADAVFDVTCAFMAQKKAFCPPIDDSNFQEFIAKLREHKLVPLASFESAKEARVSESNRAALENEAFAQILVQENKNAAFLRVYQAMTDAGAEPVCLKGCICASLWHEPTLRISADADILASGDDFRICREVLENHGYTVSHNNKTNEIGFYNSRSGNAVELHANPFDDDSPHMAAFNKAVGDLSQNPVSVAVDGVNILCPSPQNHLVYLVLHAFKHFINSGVGIRQLMDITFFCQEEGIDWDAVFESCAAVSAEGFLSGILLIANQYFGLDISAIQTPAFDRTLNCEMLLEDIKQGGIYGPRDMDKHRSGGLTVNGYVKSQGGSRGAVVFLPLKTMKKRYGYLNRLPFLLPVAWAQRVFEYAMSEHSVKNTLASGKSRIHMMEYYGIISKREKNI